MVVVHFVNFTEDSDQMGYVRKGNRRVLVLVIDIMIIEMFSNGLTIVV